MYLEGIHVTRSLEGLRAIIGKEVKYLRTSDIDRSGRGYLFPQVGKVTEVHQRHVEFNGNQDFIPISDVAEIVLID